MPTKRGNNEGTIKKRADGRWEARVSLPNGIRRSLYGKTRQEVARALATATRDLDKGLLVVSDRQTLDTFLTNWLERIKPTIRPRTWQRYRELLAHVTLSLGAVTLSRLTPQQVETLYAAKLAEGLSTTTVHHLHTVLHHALEDALRKGLVQRNVTTLVTAPKVRRHEITTLSADQASRLLAAAASDRLEALYVLALTTGMREGELLALHWRDVNLDTASLQVRGTMQRTTKGLVIGEPKTPQSRRKVSLTPLAVQALRRHRARQLEEWVALGEAWDDQDLVFCNSIGRPIEVSNLMRSSFFPLLRTAGLPRMRFHDLRHTAATLLLLQGIHAKVVAEMLGHSQISVTLNTYSHVLPDMQREATAAMERLLGGAAPNETQP